MIKQPSNAALQTRLLRELEPVVEVELNRHISTAKDWYPHEYVPWSEGRNFAGPLNGDAWEAKDSKLTPIAADSLILNLLTEDNSWIGGRVIIVDKPQGEIQYCYDYEYYVDQIQHDDDYYTGDCYLKIDELKRIQKNVLDKQKILTKKKQELITQLNLLPLVRHTLAAQEAYKNLDAEISEMDNAIHIFKNRKQVYLGSGNEFEF